MKTNYLICPGDACPLRFTCQRFSEWLNSEDDEAPEMNPDYRDHDCWAYEQREYYGN
jgi:hypothetical protein